MAQYAEPICLRCVWYTQDKPPTLPLGEGLTGMTCQAFPDGIPEEFITSEKEHRGKVEGDRNLHFIDAGHTMIKGPSGFSKREES
jgi:hypothetical protein